jgi:hypothetical protein
LFTPCAKKPCYITATDLKVTGKKKNKFALPWILIQMTINRSMELQEEYGNIKQPYPIFFLGYYFSVKKL